MIVARPGFAKYGGTMDTDFRTRRCFVVFGATGGDLREEAPNAPTEALASVRDGAVHDEPFHWGKPHDQPDARAGGRCAATGFLAPGHELVTVNGRRYIREFAPSGRRK